ncbi:serine/threonine-protein kinase [Nonomuraea sp. NPDC050404]|uniref:serine/threonine-protein kinase n=1 Tax=Nonomuraea sp. NPDC050404 TaxID=3155783 RepID=UPI0033EB5091
MPELLTLLPEDPQSVGPYRLEGRLGTGGQGTVYAGRAPDGVLVAVKLLHPHLVTDDNARERFLREVRTAKRVAPFCTAQMLDSGFVGARPYIVSEFVDGPSLQDSVKESGPRGAAALQRLAINTATALTAIHAAGVVHRDFKPGNVLLGPDGPVVIDFGIAKALDLSQSLVSSQPIGSPAYMAPEQIADGEVGPPADLFAWAATMYYAATGERAFGGEGIPATLHSVLQSEPDLSRFEGRFRQLLRECLAKDPALRPTASQVTERLRALPVPTWQDAAPGATLGGQRSTPARRRTLIALSSAAALVVAAGIGLYALGPAMAQRQTAGSAPITSVPPPAASPTPTPTPTPTGPEPSITPSPDKASDLASPTRKPRRSTAPPKDPTPSRAIAPKTPKQTPRPTRRPKKSPSPSAKPSPSKTHTRKTSEPSRPAPEPSTGTVTYLDVNSYCNAQGHSTSFAGLWGNMKCAGTDTEVTVTAVCQWKYPDYNQVVGEPPATQWSQSATCRLS